MRGLVRFLRVFGLVLLPFIGCGDYGDQGCENPCAGVNCSDGNPCTRDYCTHNLSSPTCHNEPLSDGEPCGGGNVCVEGVCRENLCADCEDDGNTCTVDCDYETGICGYVRLPDGTKCEGERHLGECRSGICIVCEELDCDDGDLCTDDGCFPEEGGCINSPVWCGDGDECTSDVCEPETGECYHVPTDENWCLANKELGLEGEYLLGLCESGRCTGRPCDVHSNETYPCPIQNPPDWGEVGLVCCHGEDEWHPRGYCLRPRTCDRTVLREMCAECPDTEDNPSRFYECYEYASGNCQLVDYCHVECVADPGSCMTLAGVCPSQ